MTSTQQRAELQRQIWQIANDVRGSVDGWDFKQYVLGTLFYRFISENFSNYIEGGDESVNYASLSDDVITPEIKDDAIKTKGYFIYPSQLFVNIAKNANDNPNLNTDLSAAFTAIESSANGYLSEVDIKGLFADFDTTSNRLGNTVKDKSELVEEVRRVIRASLGNRAKESLVVDFINQTNLDDIGDKASVIDEFFKFAQAGQLKEANELISDENLNEEAAKRYIMSSLKKEYASENGTELNAILPKMSPLNLQYLTKKQSVFQKIAMFIEKFKGVGGKV